MRVLVPYKGARTKSIASYFATAVLNVKLNSDAGQKEEMNTTSLILEV